MVLHMQTTKPLRRAAPQCGFTYLWVLLLVALMGLGLTMAVEIDATSARRERERELLVIGRQFQTALGRYHEARLAGGPKQYPTTLDELLLDNRGPTLRRHLRKVFVDPMTASSEWGLIRLGGRIVGVHSLSEQMPIKQDGFLPEHAGLKGKRKYSEWLFMYPSDLIIPAEGSLPQTAPAPATPSIQVKKEQL